MIDWELMNFSRQNLLQRVREFADGRFCVAVGMLCAVVGLMLPAPAHAASSCGSPTASIGCYTYSETQTAVTATSTLTQRNTLSSEITVSFQLLTATLLNVHITFKNATTAVSGAIDNVYFEDTNNVVASVVAGSFISTGSSFRFQAGATPTFLPGASTYNQDAVSSLTNGDRLVNGAGAGNFISYNVNLASAFTDANLQSALLAGTLSLGEHVRSIAGGSASDSFVTNNASLVATYIPEPASLALAMMGLAGISVARRGVLRTLRDAAQ